METGRKTVGVTAVALVSSQSVRGNTGVEIYSDAANEGVIYVGSRSTVTANSADATDGFPIAAGKSILIPIRNPNDIYVIASEASQKIWWMIV